MKPLCALCCCLLLVACLPALGQQTPVVYGPPVETVVLEDFGPDSASLWTSRAGANVDYSLSQVVGLPGATEGTLQASFTAREAADREPSRNWFALERTGLSMQLPPLPPASTCVLALRNRPSGGSLWLSHLKEEPPTRP